MQRASKTKSSKKTSPKAKTSTDLNAPKNEVVSMARLETAVRKITKPLRGRVKAAEETESDLRRLTREVVAWQQKAAEAEQARYEMWVNTLNSVRNLFDYMDDCLGRPRDGTRMAAERSKLRDSIEIIRSKGFWIPVNAQAAAALTYKTSADE